MNKKMENDFFGLEVFFQHYYKICIIVYIEKLLINSLISKLKSLKFDCNFYINK